MGIYVENNNGVIVCNLLIICQREYIPEFRRVYARAVAGAGHPGCFPFLEHESHESNEYSHALSLVLHPVGHIQAEAMYEFERFERLVVKTITF